MILLAIAAFATASIDVTPLTGFENAGSPSVARDSMGNVYVAFGQGKAIYIRLPERSEPVKVADGKSFALGMRRGPRLAIKGSTLVISAVGGEQGRGRDENLYAWRSIDKGRTWSGPANGGLA